jgi:hypothetical protein
VELQERNFHDMSDSATKRMEEWMLKVLNGQNLREQWTMYPKGVAKTVHLNVSGIRIHGQDEEDEVDGHFSFFIEGVPLPDTDLLNESIRGVEMLRHLPMAVCQFDMEGNVMFQNPHACMVKIVDNGDGPQDDSVQKVGEEETCSSNNTDGEDDDEGDCDDFHTDGTNSCTFSTTSCTSNGTATEESTNNSNNRSSRTFRDRRTRSRRNSDLTGGVQSRKRHCGNLVERFVDPKIARDVLRELQTNAMHNKHTSADDMNKQIDLEAMLHTHEGPKWSAVQLRACRDPGEWFVFWFPLYLSFEFIPAFALSFDH